MRRLCCFFSFLVVTSLWGFVPAAEAAKKQQDPKAFPVKVIKASETQFKHAKIVQPKAEKKGFLWFKKKKSKVVKPVMAPVVKKPSQPTVLNPVAGESKVLPKAKVPIKVQELERKSPFENATEIVPQVETPAKSD